MVGYVARYATSFAPLHYFFSFLHSYPLHLCLTFSLAILSHFFPSFSSPSVLIAESALQNVEPTFSALRLAYLYDARDTSITGTRIFGLPLEFAVHKDHIPASVETVLPLFFSLDLRFFFLKLSFLFLEFPFLYDPCY